MKKNYQGITVIEAVVSIAIFSLISGAAIQSYLLSQKLTLRAADKTKALWLSEEGIEAARSIRDQNFSTMSPGTYGLSLASGSWQFLSSSDSVDGFMRTVTISSLSTDNLYATSTVSWTSDGATSTVALGSRLTNWHKVSGTQASHTIFDVSNAGLSQSNQALLTGIVITTDGAFATTTITQIKVSWSPTTPASRKLSKILSPNGTVVFGPGSISTGTTIILPTPIKILGSSSSSIQFLWNAAMAGKVFTVLYTFSDGSTYTTVIDSNNQTQ